MKRFCRIILGTLLLSVLLLAPVMAYADEKPKLNAANKTIWVGEAMFDFEVLNIDPDDYKIVYSIKDPDMARINKTTGRVKALSAGKNSTTVVYCRLTNIETREIINLSTILYVKEKAASVKITNKELADTPLPINGTIDLDSLMYNRAGISTDKRTEYVSDYRVWYSEDPEVAVVDSETGVVTGVARGTATIWVQTYSNKSLTGTPTAEDYVTVKVTNVLATPTPSASPTVTPRPTTVIKPTTKPTVTPTVALSPTPLASPTVAPSVAPTGSPSQTPTPSAAPGVTETPTGKPVMLSAAQTALKEVTAVFSRDVSKIVTRDSFTIKNTNSKVKQIIKSVTFSEDGRSAVIGFYTNLMESTIFTIQYDTQSMTFRTTDGKVAEIELESKDVEFTVAAPLNVRLLDSTGIDVTTEERLQNVIFEYSNGYVDTFNRTITLFQVGDVAMVTAIYYTYSTDVYGTEESHTTTAVFRAVDKVPAVLKELTTSVGKREDGVDWTKRKNFVAIGDNNSYIYAKAVYDDGTESRTAFSTGDLTFMSTDTSMLLVGENDGRMIPIRQGLVEVLIMDGEDIIGTTQIKVGAARYAVSVRPSGVSARISKGLAEDTATFTFNAYDQYGELFTDGFPLTITPVTGRGNEIVDIPSYAISENSVTVSGDMFKKGGVYPYTVSYMDKSFNVNVQVVEPGTARSYRVVVENDGCDVKVSDGDVDDLFVRIKVFSYDASGYKVELIDGASTYGSENYKFGYTITKLGDDEADKATPLDGIIEYQARYVSGSVIEQAEAGTYRVVVYVSKDGTQKTRQVMTSTFRIINSQKTPTLEPCSTTISQYYTDDMILRNFYINGESVADGENANKYYMEAVTDEVGSYLWIKSVVLYENYNGFTLVHNIDNLNVTFRME